LGKYFNQVCQYFRQKNIALLKKAGLALATLISSTQWTMIVNNSFPPLHSVFNGWQHQQWDNSHARFTTAWSDTKLSKRPNYYYSTTPGTRTVLKFKAIFLKIKH